MNKPVFWVCAAFALAGSPASAAILHEPFDYPPSSPLNGQVAPNGQTWSVAGTATGVTVVEGNLTPPAGLPPSTGAMLQWGNAGSNSGAAERLGLGGPYTSGTVYWSMLFRVDDVTGTIPGTTGAFVAGFNTNAGAQTGNLTSAGGRLVMRQDATDPTKYNFGISTNSNNGLTGPQRFEDVPRSAGETFFLVGSYNIVEGTANDFAELWVNPDPTTFGAGTAPAATLTSGTGSDLPAAQGIESFFFRQNNNAPRQMTADELRVDTTWAGVTVPEPGALAPVALAAFALAARRRR